MSTGSPPVTVRLHIWLENKNAVAFGLGRVQLLDLIGTHGSLRKAASVLGMSYRAAWCKLRATEEALGLRLVEAGATKREGCHLTPEGQALRDAFRQWFDEVENCAMLKAEKIFPWPIIGFGDARRPGLEPLHAATAKDGALSPR